MKPIYEPKGKAKEYGDLAINIYTGCPHECFYCFAPAVLRRDRRAFHDNVRPRDGIVEAVRKQIQREKITGKLVHLCFTCDPYPVGYDTDPTREIIKALKESGNYVQILTKGDGRRDFDLLDENDWYGIALTEMVEVKPRVVLQPFRTFVEVAQPESEFLLRISDKGEIGLFPADGGVWKLEATRNVAAYFEEKLQDLIEKGLVIVIR